MSEPPVSTPIDRELPHSTMRVGLALLLFILGPACVTAISAASSPDGLVWLQPSLRDEDGRFANPIGELLRGTAGVRVPFFWGRIKATLAPRPGARIRVGSGPATSVNHLRAGTPSPGSGTRHFSSRWTASVF